MNREALIRIEPDAVAGEYTARLFEVGEGGPAERALAEGPDVATATGIAGMFGYLGGALFTLTVGALASTIGYEPLFALLFLFDVVASLVLWAFIGARKPAAVAQPAV